MQITVLGFLGNSKWFQVKLNEFLYSHYFKSNLKFGGHHNIEYIALFGKTEKEAYNMKIMIFPIK